MTEKETDDEIMGLFVAGLFWAVLGAIFIPLILVTIYCWGKAFYLMIFGS
jgi:hypothetical protein